MDTGNADVKPRTILFSPLLVGATLYGIGVHYLCVLYFIDFVLPLRRPIQDWMVTLGLGSIAPYYAFVNLQLPYVAWGAISGTILGTVAPRTWVLGATCYLVGTHLPAVLHGGLSASYLGHSAIYQLPYVIPAIGVTGWLCARRRLRIDARRLDNRCTRCGYDLQGSGRICPECGHSTADAQRKV